MAVPAFAAGDDVPAWLRQAASAATPVYDKKVPAVVLLDEQQVTVGDDGRVTTVTNYAVRILAREGREAAFAREVYNTDTGKVREMHAWLLRPSGEVKKYGKDEVMDMALAPDDVYNEARLKAIFAERDADAGVVFGYQVTSEDRSIFTQFEWNFQGRLPTLISRYQLTLPAGWRAQSVTFNHDKLEPTVNASTYSWELHDLPYIEEEPASPAVTNIAPRLAVSYFPPQNGPQTPGSPTFSNWTEVSRWLTNLSEPQSMLDDTLAGKVRELTANSKTELERIRAIGHFARNIHYISIQTGIGRGGGYRPHSATEVLAKSYGDCKDKANLMRTMLKAVKIPSYLVAIYSGDPTYVREEWASPQQFNHVIIAVKVSDDTQGPTIITHPTLGRLLIFDPTEENTPVGDLPDYEQNSFALIVAGESGTLVRMPTTPPEANRLERQADVVLTPEGSINASVQERSIGQSAVSERRAFRGSSRPDYMKLIERWITAGATGAKVSKVEPVDNTADASFALAVEFNDPAYAQLMQGRLLVFKPAIVSRRESLFLTEKSRTAPVVLESHAYTETVRVKLPAGFDVDELPDALKLDTPFGAYATTYAVKDDQLTFTRTLTLRATTIPANQYAAVRTFFERIRAAEQSPVVLAKK
ncbi:MAG TPA: DUF3857 domain-containing protein [Pyrinomonadaceae bacterium]|nr:DUF3857 domain-containing protein [Pyrinomonadaceae bacterium]